MTAIFRTIGILLCLLVCTAAAQPVITDCPAQITRSHCQVFAFPFQASGDGLITYRLLSGPGSINPQTGLWKAVLPPGEDTLVVGATNLSGSDTCQIELVATNVAPVIECPSHSRYCSVGQWSSIDVNSTDDCDVIYYSLVDSGGVSGDVTIDRNTGVVRYRPVASDSSLSQPITFRVAATDWYGAYDTCSVQFVVRPQLYVVQLDVIHNAFQGQWYYVNITLVVSDSSAGLGRFDFTIAYDAQALGLVEVTQGELLTQCGWEYFASQPAGCSGSCPSGLLNIVGLADLNYGEQHPLCDVGALPAELAKVRFVTSTDRRYGCYFFPVRFFWMDCGDNFVFGAGGAPVFLSRDVFDAGFPTPLSNDLHGFPTYLGTQQECMVDSGYGKPIRAMDFVNGGIDFICSEPPYDYGDLNTNGLPCEFADADLFIEYFQYGLEVFGANQVRAVAQSDVNQDGVPLTAADLMSLITCVNGLGIESGQASSHCNLENGLVTTGDTLGVLVMTIAGAEPVQLLASDVLVQQVVDSAGNTRIIVYPDYHLPQSLSTFTGAILQYSGEILSIEAATYDCRQIDFSPTAVDDPSENLPTNFALDQNYPNPFNPVTTICFDLPTAGPVSLQVLNLQGQVVRTLAAGQKSAGRYTVSWDGRNFDGENVASGIYFYRLTANDFIQTRKMLLIK